MPPRVCYNPGVSRGVKTRDSLSSYEVEGAVFGRPLPFRYNRITTDIFHFPKIILDTLIL